MTPASIEKLAGKIFEDPAEKAAFIAAIEKPQALSPAILQLGDIAPPFETLPPLEGQLPFIKRLAPGTQPSKHHLHDEGAYYCLDYSSAFAASVMAGLPANPDVVLDVCAAPGGKSIFAKRALNPRLLLSNEIVIGRAKALISNFKRCGLKGTKILNFSSEVLARRLPAVADLVILDVPCSGQSLMVKGKHLTGTFHSHVVSGNVKRQRRILSQAAECVKPGGYLAYMTCTFSPDENEKNVGWFLERFQEFEAQEVPLLSSYRSHLSDFPSYRIWPHRQPVAGAFSALLKKKEEAVASPSEVDSLITELNPIWES